MSWDNYGKWHVDHVIPIMYREPGQDITEEVIIKRLHYKNLQPLWAKENMSAGNKLKERKM